MKNSPVPVAGLLSTLIESATVEAATQLVLAIVALVQILIVVHDRIDKVRIQDKQRDDADVEK